MKVNVLLLNSIIISLISGCSFFPDVEVDDIIKTIMRIFGNCVVRELVF